MTESEPNDTSPEADGPIPAAGYTATRATPDDHDKFILRLQPQRQVTITMNRVSGCRYSVNSNPTVFTLTRSDGKRQQSFSNWSSEVHTDSWTTPAVAVEYIGDIYGDYWWEGNQCTVSVVVTPADAVIEGPLPARPARDAAVAPVDIAEGKEFSTSITGHAYTGDTLRTWFTTAGDACTSTTAGTKTAVPAGPFTVPVTMKAEEAGYATICAVLTNTESGLIQDMVAPVPVAVRGVRPVSMKSKKVRIDSSRKATLRLRCDLPAGDVCGAALTVRTKTGRDVAQVTATIPAGKTKKVQFKVSAKLARTIRSSGAVAAVVSGTVTRTGLGTIKAPKIALLLLPPG
jgi:hypothetical protein